MKHLSLFSGIGGIDLAAEMAGFIAIGQVEIDDYCNRVLSYRWPDVPRWRDVKDVTAETFEKRTGIQPGSLALLSGGFPCQPFSCAGKRRGREDERYLWGEMLRVICELRPRWVLAENVRGLLSIDAGRTFGRILADLAENGYRVGWLCYGAGDIGAPHKRERVFIVAHAASMERQAGAEVEGVLRKVFIDQRKHDNADRPSKTRNMAYPTCGKSRQPETGDGWEGAGRGSESMAHAGQGPAQPGMGGMFDGLSAGLAGHRWPGGPGEQHEWEPPRIVTGVKDRVNKLKALGNAVVPAQVYPILRAIMKVAGCVRVIGGGRG